MRFWGWYNTSPKLALRFMHPFADFSLPPFPSPSLGLLSGAGGGGVWAIITGSIKHQCEWEVPFLRIFKFIDTKLCVSRVINTKPNNNGIKKGFYPLINLVYLYLFWFMISLYFKKIMCTHLNLHMDFNDCPSQIKDITVDHVSHCSSQHNRLHFQGLVQGCSSTRTPWWRLRCSHHYYIKMYQTPIGAPVGQEKIGH